MRKKLTAVVAMILLVCVLLTGCSLEEFFHDLYAAFQLGTMTKFEDMEYVRPDPDAFSDLVAISQVTPGPIAVNAATFVGLNYAGIPGSVIATLGVCMPSFLLMLVAMKFIDRFNDSRGIQGAFFGIRPVTVGLIASAAVFVSETVLINGPLISTKLFTSGMDYFNIIPLILFAITIVLVGVLKMRPIRVMILMGIAGAILCG